MTLGWIRGDQLADLSEFPYWGPWRLYPPTLVLVHITDDGYEGYEVDLEQCLNSGELCDWIFQVGTKGWGDDATVAGLVRALDEIIEPQANLCSYGTSTAISRHRIAELVEVTASRRPDMIHTRPADGA